MVVAVNGFLHKRLCEFPAVEDDMVVGFLEYRRVRFFQVIYKHVVRARDFVVTQRLVHGEAVAQQPLFVEAVDLDRLDEFHVVNRFFERKTARIKRDQTLHFRPLLDRLRQNTLVAKDDDVKHPARFQAPQQRLHRVPVRFCVHAAQAERDLSRRDQRPPLSPRVRPRQRAPPVRPSGTGRGEIREKRNR